MRVYSIFSSINGEVCSSHQGSMCTFIRLAGCSVGCSYCDTQYASDHNSGKTMDMCEIMEEVVKFGNKNVTITGGEPLEQLPYLMTLIKMLASHNYKLSVETSGEIPFNILEIIPHWGANDIHFVTDIKLNTKNHLHDYNKMWHTSEDFFKIIIGSTNDIIQAIHIKNELQHYGCKAKFAFSPMEGKLSPKELLVMMQDFDQNDVVLNVQIHKLIGLTEDK